MAAKTWISKWRAPEAWEIGERTTIERLRDSDQLTRPLLGWLVTIAVTAVAFLIRLVGVANPNRLVFDETYYPKDAWSIIHFGYERDWPKEINDTIAAGNTDVWESSSAFVVHPPLGKLLIGAGEYLFGMNSFGWRISAVVFGTLLVFFTIRLARRLSRSTLVGAMAGILLTFDGLAFVMSRIGLLDIFQATFIVAGVACIAADRDWFRLRLARYLERRGQTDLGGRYGPILFWRPWRVLAGAMFGLGCAVKWNTLYVIAAMGILSVIWDISARRLAGAGPNAWWSPFREGVTSFISLVILPIPVYLATWSGWLLTSEGWGRQWGAKPPEGNQAEWLVRHHDALVGMFGAPLASLAWYHQQMYGFHTGDFIRSQTHAYEAHPAGWLLMVRPIGIDAVNDIKPGTGGCPGPDNCLQVISGLGTPLLWWAAALALLVGIVWWVTGRDSRYALPIVAGMSTYLTWFPSADRPLFFFYAITIIPFTTIILAMLLGQFLGPPDWPKRKRRAWMVGSYIALVAANFAFIYPILTDQILPRSHWLARMWLSTWI